MRTWRADEWTAEDWAEWETSRHQCEVRWVLELRAKEGHLRASGYLRRVGEKRGQKARERLEDDCREQWKLGNRGRHGDWRVAKTTSTVMIQHGPKTDI